MTGIRPLIERVEMSLRAMDSDQLLKIYIDVYDTNLGRRWLSALIDVIRDELHLEKNYCFVGFPESARNGHYLCDQINASIAAINQAELGYHIDDEFVLDQLLRDGPVGDWLPGCTLDQSRFNRLHQYFEDLQGISGCLSPYYQRADDLARWHIRQLNLLCHEFETWALSHRKSLYAPEWVRPSQLMCWLRAPRFALEEQDLELFGIESLYRDLGGVYVGVNKAIGKHHWEVFNDEGRDSRLDELTTSTLRSQTEAAADFDIEWAQDTRGHPWMHSELDAFRKWLTDNGFDPEDPALTIGHPKVAQVDLASSFAGHNTQQIWNVLSHHMDVYSISAGGSTTYYDYRWQDHNYQMMQIQALKGQ